MDAEVSVPSTSRGLRHDQRRLCGSAASSSCSDDDHSDTSDDAPLLAGCRAVRVDVEERESADKPASPYDKFPKQRGRAFAAFLLQVCAALMNDIVLSFIHEKVPSTPPLPDIGFAHLPYYPEGLVITEYLMLSGFAVALAIIFFHKHRWIVIRRLFSIGSVLYFSRCVTMLVTQVPVADPNYYCSPKLGKNATIGAILWRALQIASGVGLKLNGKHTLCGDYIFSGHTIVLCCSALFICEYSPKRWRLLHALSWLSSIVGMVFLVISRGHYTLDVVISYAICTRVFWAYHTLAAHPTLRSSAHNHFRKDVVYSLFLFMEGGINKPVPRRYNCPFPVSVVVARIPVLRRLLKPAQQ